MVRKLRLISSNSIEIAVTGIDSPFLDTLLTDHPHKVATISIPYSDKAVVDFAKNVANPDLEINRSAARKIVSIYKLLGVDIDVEAAHENATNNVSNTEVVDHTLDCEHIEPKYIIKIELGQHQQSSSSSEAECPNSTEDVEPELLNSHLEVNDVDNVFTQESEQSQTHVNSITPRPIPEDISHSTGPVPNQLEPGEAVEESENSTNYNINESQKLQSDISVGDIVIEDMTENTEVIEPSTNELVTQPPLEGDVYDENIDAEFSFHDLEEESPQETHAMVQGTRQSCSEEGGNVISNIFILTTSSQSSDVSARSSQLEVFQHPLKLEFIKNGLHTIKDIAKKRKRKRGQN